MNKKIIAIIVVIIVVAGVVGYVIKNKNASPKTPAPTDRSAEITVPTKDYSNKALGLTMKYPDTYVYTEKDTVDENGHKRHTITFVYAQDKDKTIDQIQTSMSIDIFDNPSKLPIEEWLDATPSSNISKLNGNPAPAIVAGEPAVTYPWDGTSHKASSVVFEYNKTKVLMATMTYTSDPSSISKDFSVLMRSLSVN